MVALNALRSPLYVACKTTCWSLRRPVERRGSLSFHSIVPASLSTATIVPVAWLRAAINALTEGNDGTLVVLVMNGASAGSVGERVIASKVTQEPGKAPVGAETAGLDRTHRDVQVLSHEDVIAHHAAHVQGHLVAQDVRRGEPAEATRLTAPSRHAGCG